jgi:hypothetical protein
MLMFSMEGVLVSVKRHNCNDDASSLWVIIYITWKLLNSWMTIMNSYKGKAAPLHTLKANVGVKAQLHTFLTSPLDGDEWSASYPDLFTPRGISPYTL